MEDPPRHEVMALEEELKTDLGWFHVKTVDLAPFRSAVRTSIYQGGERLICHDDNYTRLYEQGVRGTEIARRVERIHHQSVELLQRGGVEAWCIARA
jgi:hypothetical protein